MGQSKISGLSSFALICFATLAHASSGDVKSWLAQAWEDAAKLPDLGDANIKWRSQRLYVPPDAQLETLRRAVAGHPDHPDRAELALFERRLRGEKDETIRQLWCHGDGQWRQCRDFQSNNLATGQFTSSFADTVVVRDRHWQLSPDHLLIEPPDVSANSEIGGVVRVRSEFINELSYMINGGMSGARQSKTVLGEVTVNGSRWSAIAARPPSASGKEYRIKFDGRWDQAQSRGFVERMEIVTNQYKPEVVGSAWVFSDWRVDPASDRAIAWKVEGLRPGGVPDTRYIVEHFGVEPGKSFDEAIRLPAVAGQDAIRGKVTVQFVDDLTKGVRTNLATGTEVPLGIMPRRVAADAGKVSWLAWISSSCVLVGFGLAGYRRWRLRRSVEANHD